MAAFCFENKERCYDTCAMARRISLSSSLPSCFSSCCRRSDLRSFCRLERQKFTVSACHVPAASGADADDDDDTAFDTAITQRWVAWRDLHPVRASGGVLRTYHQRPGKDEQSAWHSYTNRDPSTGRILQGWWKPPFLVPIAEVALVQGPTPDCTQKAVLPQFSDSPASGGPKTRQHYTNIFRVECLARSHPLVVKVEFHKLEEKSQVEAEFDIFGRAVRL